MTHEQDPNHNQPARRQDSLPQPLFVAACLLLLSTAHICQAHPYHVSHTEAEWNAKTRRLEISVRVCSDDIEAAIRRRFARRVLLENKSAEEWIERYVKSEFRVRSRDGKSAGLSWVGYEVSLKATWLYFEVPLIAGPDGIEIANTILLQDVPRQVNLVSLRDAGRRATLHFTAGNPTQEVIFASARS